MKLLRSPYTWLGIGIAVIVFIQLTAPKPVSWEYTYENSDKNPYGGWIAAEYLKRTFAGDMKIVKSSLWTITYRQDKPTSTESHVIVTNVFRPDTLAQRMILNNVYHGGTLFVAAYSIDDALASAIGVQEENPGTIDTITFKTLNGRMSHGVASATFGTAFKSKDSTAWQALAYSDTSAVLTSRSWGKGTIILCGIPSVLTNSVFLDTAKHDLPVAMFSSLPDKPIAWDEYYKPKRVTDMTVNKAIGSIPGLSLAYWILIVTGVVYLVMAGRRRQRAIPVVREVRNTSLDFVTTVGRLYFGRHDNQNLAAKLTRLFRDYVVHRLRLRIDVDDKTLAQSISSASGADINLIVDILRRVSHADSGLHFTDEETVAFHNDLQLFQQQSTI